MSDNWKTLFPPTPMFIFADDYPLTDQEVADIKALYGGNTLVRTSKIVPSGKVLQFNLPDPIERMKGQAAILDRLRRGSS